MNFTDDIEELVYQSYLEIGTQDYQERIRFFERNKTTIALLPYELRLELSLDYSSALFEVGEHYEFLKHVDKLLEAVIMDNIYSVDGDDIYQELLFRKASAMHTTMDLHGADHVYSELVKINSSNSLYRMAFVKNNTSLLNYLGQKYRAITISMVLICGLLIGIELLIIRPFYESYTTYIEWSRNLLLGLAILGMIFHELYVRYLAKSRLGQIVNNKL